MVENVNEHNDVKTIIRERQLLSVKLCDRDVCLWAKQHVNSQDREVGPFELDPFAKQTITTPDIQHARVRRN